jgi:hypothetical protein
MLATADRAYEAYETCVRTVSNGPALQVWAARQTPQEIEVRIRFRGTAGQSEVCLDGTVTGGYVASEQVGRLWSRSWRDWLPGVWQYGDCWKANGERLIVVRRTSDAPETAISVRPRDGSEPVRLVFQKANGLIRLEYVGWKDIERRKDVAVSVQSPNNHENRGDCPNSVGRTDTRICISRTEVVLSTASPCTGIFGERAPGLAALTARKAQSSRPRTDRRLGHFGTIGAQRFRLDLSVTSMSVCQLCNVDLNSESL